MAIAPSGPALSCATCRRPRATSVGPRAVDVAPRWRARLIGAAAGLVPGMLIFAGSGSAPNTEDAYHTWSQTQLSGAELDLAPLHHRHAARDRHRLQPRRRGPAHSGDHAAGRDGALVRLTLRVLTATLDRDTNFGLKMSAKRPAVEVHKFGGASLTDAASYKNAVAIIRSRQAPRAIVVSAPAGVTDALLGLAGRAVAGKSADLEKDAGALRARYRKLAQGLVPPGSARQEVIDEIDRSFDELDGLLRSLLVLSELTARTSDFVLARGERLSARLMAAALNAAGTTPRYVDAVDVVITDGPFGGASPNLMLDRPHRAQDPAPAAGVGRRAGGARLPGRDPGRRQRRARQGARDRHARPRRIRSDRDPARARAGRRRDRPVEGRARPADRRIRASCPTRA